ncbi:hypothetical protein P692DRAFT_20879623 [Suillus brevipes Sb2]|nr:hypothetical protein P692DRAFT_20879623 [Suillus brevipes Sb2]
MLYFLWEKLWFTDAEVEGAKRLLHKCVSQYIRQQQLHAQQAARYLRGFSDDISSHKTVAMLSGLLLLLVKDVYALSIGEPGDDSPDDVEHSSLMVQTDKAGRLITMNQVHHYWYRGDGLQHMCFYDFCRFVRLELKEKSDKNLHTADT